MRTITIIQWILVAILVLLAFVIFNMKPPRREGIVPAVIVLDLHPDASPQGDPKRPSVYHAHCPEEINGGGYRGGKFTYTRNGSP